MNAEALAIWGIFLWVWAHERTHAYEGNPRTWTGLMVVVLSVTGCALMLVAFFKALGYA